MSHSMRTLAHVDLDPSSLLYFVHIPKTAGTSMRRFLDRYFLPQQVFPPEITVPPHHPDRALLNQFPADALDRYRLVVGHHRREELGPYLAGCRKRLHYVTVLRDPVEQILSEYKMLISDPQYPYHDQYKHLSLSDFLDHDAFPWICRGNRTLAHLAIQNNDDYDAALSVEGLAEVRAWLSGFAGVGIHERLPETLELFSYVFGWNGPVDTPHCNAARVASLQVSDPERARLERLTQLDRELYDDFRDRFDVHYANMLGSLNVPCDAHELTSRPPALRERIREALDRAAQQRRAARREACGAPSHTEVIRVEGLHAGHLNRPWGRYIQWVGPGCEATIDVALPDVVDRVVYLRVDHALQSAMVEQLELLVNGHALDLQRTVQGDRCDLVGVLPRWILLENESLTRLVLRVPSVARPCDLDPHNPDTELKSVAISAIELLPVSVATLGDVWTGTAAAGRSTAQRQRRCSA